MCLVWTVIITKFPMKQPVLVASPVFGCSWGDTWTLSLVCWPYRTDFSAIYINLLRASVVYSVIYAAHVIGVCEMVLF